MSTRYTLAITLLVIILAISLNCTRYYYKQFGTGAEPGLIYNGFSFRFLDCGININARPNSTGSFKDSSYYVKFFIFGADSCDQNMSTVFNSIDFHELYLAYNNIILPLIQSNITRYSGCNYSYEYNNVDIPNEIDTVKLHINMSYMMEARTLVADTIITLYRYQGRRIEPYAY